MSALLLALGAGGVTGLALGALGGGLRHRPVVAEARVAELVGELVALALDEAIALVEPPQPGQRRLRALRVERRHDPGQSAGEE